MIIKRPGISIPPGQGTRPAKNAVGPVPSPGGVTVASFGSLIKHHKRKKRGTILVIDDEPDICELFERIFCAEGWTVLSAHNGLEGVACNTASNPDVIILDLKMPKMDGVETLKAIRKTDPAVRVIILTGYGSAATIRDALDLNVYEYISKPFENDTIRRVVGDALGDNGG